MINNLRSFVLFASLMFASSGAMANESCGSKDFEPNSLIFKADNLEVRALAKPNEIKVGKTFELDIIICEGADGLAVSKADARMPRHGHGMNYAAKVERLNTDTFHAGPFLFHMPGLWEFALTVKSPSGTNVLTQEIEIAP